jgi:hypothetical protein
MNKNFEVSKEDRKFIFNELYYKKKIEVIGFI